MLGLIDTHRAEDQLLQDGTETEVQLEQAVLERLRDGRSITVSDYRYERKALIQTLERAELDMLVRLHPAHFSEIFHPRYVNNVYLDTVDRTCYFDAVDGNTKRVKVRVRWYGDVDGSVVKPTLELKTKGGLVGRKISCPLQDFVMDERFDAAFLQDVFRASNLPEQVRPYVHSVEPVLLNRYLRTYYASASADFRITIDSELSYIAVGSSHNTFLHQVTDDDNAILELKYACAKEDTAHHIWSYFPFRVTKSSKYTMGLDRLAYY